jgi:hypothetical protein
MYTLFVGRFTSCTQSNLSTIGSMMNGPISTVRNGSFDAAAGPTVRAELPGLLTVAEVAAELRFKKVDSVLALIACGTLRAIDVSRPRSKKPRWRIRRDDLETFLWSRTKSPTPAGRRPRRVDPDVTEYCT